MFEIYGCKITIQIAIYIISQAWFERPGAFPYHPIFNLCPAVNYAQGGEGKPGTRLFL